MNGGIGSADLHILRCADMFPRNHSMDQKLNKIKYLVVFDELRNVNYVVISYTWLINFCYYRILCTLCTVAHYDLLLRSNYFSPSMSAAPTNFACFQGIFFNPRRTRTEPAPNPHRTRTECAEPAPNPHRTRDPQPLICSC